MITNEEIINIQRSVNIVDIIGEYVTLQKKGRNFVGICPFHDDHSPSMSVSEEKQIYTCFVCHNSGNVFRFLMNYENISFIEAVKHIASKSGIKLSNNIKINNDKHHEYYECLDLAVKYYQNNLKTEEGKKALDYLHNRGISDETIDEFQIGYASNDNSLINVLEKKGYNDNILVDVGLCNASNQAYLIIKNRITFPIFNANGYAVAFSSRVFNGEVDNKYINTRETIIFKKSEVLFNYHKASKEARKSKSIILVEGQMDAIRIYSSGIKNVCATMGTALTKEHIKLLSKLNVKVILCMDNDEAGKTANIKNGELLQENHIETNVITLSGSKDPDEYILKNGVDKFIDAINNSVPFFDYHINTLKNNVNLEKVEDISKYINTVMLELNKVNDEVLTNLTINKLSQEYGVDKKVLYNKVLNNNKNIISLEKKSSKTLKKHEKLASLMLYYMMNDVRYIKAYEKEVKGIPIQKYDIIASDLLAFYLKNNYINIADFISCSLNSSNYRDVLDIIDSNIGIDLNDEEFIGIINKVNSWVYSEKINDLKTKLIDVTDINEKIKITDEIADLKKRMCDL